MIRTVTVDAEELEALRLLEKTRRYAADINPKSDPTTVEALALARLDAIRARQQTKACVLCGVLSQREPQHMPDCPFSETNP